MTFRPLESRTKHANYIQVMSIPQSRTAFVLAGGGSLGAVEVGMLHALTEHGLRPDFVVGAINGAYFASDGRPSGPFQSRAYNPAFAKNRPTQALGSRSYMTTIRVKENEPFDVALRRFKRTIEKLGLLTDLRAREFYEKPTAERKRKKAAAVKRHFKRVRSMMLPKKLF